MTTIKFGFFIAFKNGGISIFNIMSLKVKNILFTGPFNPNNYEYKKNKPPTIILFICKKGPDYNPLFYAFKIIKANEADLNFKSYINNEINNQFKDFSIFIREYSNSNKGNIDRDFKLINNSITKNILLEMSY